MVGDKLIPINGRDKVAGETAVTSDPFLLYS